MKLLGKGIKTCVVSDVKKHNDKNCFDQKSEGKDPCDRAFEHFCWEHVNTKHSLPAEVNLTETEFGQNNNPHVFSIPDCIGK